MKRLLFLLPLITGCIIVDDGNDKDYNWDDWDTGWKDYEDYDEESNSDDVEDSPDLVETEEDTSVESPDGSFFLVPNAGAPGDTFISSLRSIDTLNWASIHEITAYGNIEICNTQTLFDEILLTITIPEDASEAPIDLIVEYTDGDIDLIEDALYINQNADIGTAEVDRSACE